jgi:hypothetical protein
MARHHRSPDEWEAERGSLWATFIRRCVTIPPKLDHSRLAKLSSPRLLAAQQRAMGEIGDEVDQAAW